MPPPPDAEQYSGFIEMFDSMVRAVDLSEAEHELFKYLFSMPYIYAFLNHKE